MKRTKTGIAAQEKSKALLPFRQKAPRYSLRKEISADLHYFTSELKLLYAAFYNVYMAEAP